MFFKTNFQQKIVDDMLVMCVSLSFFFRTVKIILSRRKSAVHRLACIQKKPMSDFSGRLYAPVIFSLLHAGSKKKKSFGVFSSNAKDGWWL
jgi:hypothetical protein